MTPVTPVTPERFMITREQIQEPEIVVLDRDHELELVGGTPHRGKEMTKLQHAARGVVFYKDQVVFRGFGITPELVVGQDSLPTWDLSQCQILDALEGTVLRLFYTQNQWYCSTPRRLDAFTSKWASQQTFGDLFLLALESSRDLLAGFRARLSSEQQFLTGRALMDAWLNTLDSTYQYTLLLQHTPETRIVCDAPYRPLVWHIASSKPGEFAQVGVGPSIGLMSPQQHTFQSMEELIDFTQHVNIQRIQGVVVFHPNGVTKLLSEEYKFYFDIRGNEPSVKFRYLQLRMDPIKRYALMDLYPSEIVHFDEYENILYQFSHRLMDAYIQRYVKRSMTQVPQEEYTILKQLYTWHKQNRKQHRITLKVIQQLLNEQPATKLNRLIRHATRINTSTQAREARETKPTRETREIK
jgi:hypothetical protein